MKAIRIYQFGGPEVLKYETNVPIPTPGPSDVLVKVKAVGINPVETYIRSGTYSRKPALPTILGNDCAGIVEQVGSNVAMFKPGDRVFVSKTNTGAYAEFTVSPATNVYQLPEVLSFSQGLLFPCRISQLIEHSSSEDLHGLEKQSLYMVLVEVLV